MISFNPQTKQRLKREYLIKVRLRRFVGLIIISLASLMTLAYTLTPPV